MWTVGCVCMVMLCCIWQVLIPLLRRCSPWLWEPNKPLLNVIVLSMCSAESPARHNWCPWPGLKNWRNGQGFGLNQSARWRVFWIRTRGWMKAGCRPRMGSWTTRILRMMRKLSWFCTGRVLMSVIRRGGGGGGYPRCAGGDGHSAGGMVSYDGASQ